MLATSSMQLASSQIPKNELDHGHRVPAAAFAEYCPMKYIQMEVNIEYATVEGWVFHALDLTRSTRSLEKVSLHTSMRNHAILRGWEREVG